MTPTASPPTPAETSADDVLPFGEFLSSLRASGIDVGLHDYRALARLLERWPLTSRVTLRDAIAALVARNEKEVADVRAAFDDWFPEESEAEESGAPKTKRVPRRRVLLIGALLLALAASAIGVVWMWQLPPFPITPRAMRPPPTETPVKPPQPQPVRLPPALPPPPRGTSTRLPAAAAAIAALVAAIFAAEVRTRRRRAAWTRSYLDESLDAAGGPARYEPVVERSTPLVPREWLEEVATIVGRATENERESDKLDVEESLRLTLRNGLRPYLAFEPPPRGTELLLLQDTATEMRPWRARIDALVRELIRQRVPIERWFFDADPSLVWSERTGRRLSLERLAAQRGELSLLVVSTGEDVARLLEGDSTVPALLRRWTYRSWLNPIANMMYWPAALSQLPIRVWPATRNGLRGMAWDLARAPQVVPRELVDAPRAVTAADVERMKRLIALVPSPTIALADELRRRYASDVPEEVVLFLAAEGAFRGERYHLPQEELLRLLAAARRDEPSRERRIRQYLLEVLRQSEPAGETIAHLRWQLDLAMQHAHIAAIEDESGAEPVGALAALAAGPLRDEVKAAAATVHNAPRLESAIRRTLRNAAARIPNVVPESVRNLPPRAVWPGVAGLVIAALIAALSYAALRPLGRGAGDPIEHVLAYELRSAVNDAGNDVVFFLLRQGFPASATLLIDGMSTGREITNGVAVPLAPGHPGAYYQVQARLAAGNLAVSNALWVPAQSQSTGDQSIEELIAETLGVDAKRVTPAATFRNDLGATDAELARLEVALEGSMSIKVKLAGLGDPPLVTVADVKRAIETQRNSGTVTVTVWVDGRSIAEVPITFEALGRARQGMSGHPIQLEAGRWKVSGRSAGFEISTSILNVVPGQGFGLLLTATAVEPEPADGTIIVRLTPPLTLSDIAIRGLGGEDISRKEKMLSPTKGVFTVRPRPSWSYVIFVKNPMYGDEKSRRGRAHYVKVEPGSTNEITMGDEPEWGTVTIEGSVQDMQARLANAGGEGPTLASLGGGKYKLNAKGGTYDIEVQFPAKGNNAPASPWIKTTVKVVNGQSTRSVIERDILVQTERSSGQGTPSLSPNARALEAFRTAKADDGRNISAGGVYTIRVNDLPEITAAASRLRAKGFRVQQRHDSDSSSKNVADYSVILIGSRVSAEAAREVIRTARPLMPWLEYIFIQSDGLDDDVIQLTAYRYSRSFVFMQLRPLSEFDFTRLSMTMSDEEFFRLARSFSIDAKAPSTKKK